MNGIKRVDRSRKKELESIKVSQEDTTTQKRMEKIMYKFTSLTDKNSYIPGSKIADLQLFQEHNEIKIQGILKTLFGEPFYETER